LLHGTVMHSHACYNRYTTHASNVAYPVTTWEKRDFGDCDITEITHVVLGLKVISLEIRSDLNIVW